jgi:magnesium-transporting ATPase (P-type)
LSEAEAQARLEKYGRNELTAEKPVPAWRKFLAQFQDVLVMVLLIATLISAGIRPKLEPVHSSGRVTLGHLLMDDSASRRHPLNITSTN